MNSKLLITHSYHLLRITTEIYTAVLLFPSSYTVEATMPSCCNTKWKAIIVHNHAVILSSFCYKELPLYKL